MLKLTATISVAMLSLLFAVPAAVYAQDEPKTKQEESKAESKHDEEKHQEEAKPPKQDQPKQQEERNESKPSNNNAKPSRQQEQNQPAMQHGGQGKTAGQSAHIPDDKFRSHFGRSHTVVINRPVIVEGQPRFQSAGYWFVIDDPWPDGWAYTDDCYIDYIDDEYFLFDLLHPGVRVALVVVL